MKKILFLWLIIFLNLLSSPFPAVAIELHPSDADVERAIQEGKDAVETGNYPNEFGIAYSRGHVRSKLYMIWSESYETARKFQDPSKEKIKDYLTWPSLAIKFYLCTDQVDQNGSHMVLKQGEKIIQPEKIETGHVEATGRTTSPVFCTPIVGRFKYGTFDPIAKSSVIIVPARGERMEYQADFSEMR